MLLFAAMTIGWMAEPAIYVGAPLKLQPRFLQVGLVTTMNPPPLAGVPSVLHLSVTPPAPQTAYIVTLAWTPDQPPPVLVNGTVWNKGTWQGFGPGGSKWIYTPYDLNQLFKDLTKPNPANQLQGILSGVGWMNVNGDSPYSAGPLTVPNYGTFSVAP